jgi:hypothetical protein
VSRLFRHFALAAVISVAAAAPAHAADFLTAIEDVPLPKGMIEQAEPVVFESDQGRVVRAAVTGNLSCKDMETFYATALPALGWTRQGNEMAFRRDNEQLKLDMICGLAHGPFTAQISFELVVKLAGTRLPQ